MSAFGGKFGMDEPELTDQIDDDYDTMNDETFGVELPTDEWEADHIAEELEAAEAAVAAAAAEKSILDYAASRLPIIDDPLEFLKEDILQLVEEDDDVPIGRGKKSSTGSKPLTDIFAPGSPQTPFFLLDQGSRNIWSDSLPSLVRSAPNASSQSVTGLLERMRGDGFGGLPTAEPPAAPVLVKGAKTAEELEAEMLGRPVASTAPKLVGPAVKSCAELERELIESSRNAGVMPAASPVKPPFPGMAPGPDGQGQQQGPPGMPQLPNMLMRHPPPQHPLANPQVRAALLARWMAANPGAQPPIWFRMPPPPMMPPPPRVGFGMPGNQYQIHRPPGPPGPNMPPMNFNNTRLPQNVDPRAIGLIMQQQGAMRRPMPHNQNFPKRRLFDSPGRFGNDYEYRHRDRDRDRDRDHYHHNRDPFAGLMTRRERSWLIKIQTLQLHSENPFVDDYYWMMYRRRKMTGDNVYKDSDHNDNFEHRVYVPPSFEGSLGKVQVLSANFPRQVLDLTTAAEKQQSLDEGSPRDSPPMKSGQPITSGRRLKNILMEIENLYLMVLEANDLTLMQDQNPNPSGENEIDEETKEKAAARIKSLVQGILTSLLFEDRIVSTLAVRKGRRLIALLLPHCDKVDTMKLMQAVLRNLPSISKKEPLLEILAAIKLILDAKQPAMNEADWTKLWETINLETIENVLKQKLGSAILLLLVQRSAIDGVKLSEGASKSLERWASITYTTVTNGNKEGSVRVGSLTKNQAEHLSFWLKNVAGASIPPSVVDSIISSLTV